MKKSFLVFLLLFLGFGGIYAQTFDIIEITDFHGTLTDANGSPVSAILAKNIQKIQEKNPGQTIVVGGGDLYQGSALSNELKGIPVQKVLDQMGMEVTALGNHEFDWTIDTFKNITIKNAKHEIVCANVYNQHTKKRVFAPYKIITKKGVRFAFIGATTLSSRTEVLHKNIQDYYLTDITQEISALAKEIKKNKKAEVVIALLHAGGTINGQGEIFEIAERLKNVDAILGGHSHTIVNTKVKRMPVAIANYNGMGFVDLKITIDDAGKLTFESSYVELDEKLGEDEEVKKIVKAAQEQIGPIFQEIIGTSGQYYPRKILGKWVSEIIRKKTKADAGIQNTGGLKTDINKGKITIENIYALMPFDNTICITKMKKAQLQAVLNQAMTKNPEKTVYFAGIMRNEKSGEITREDGTPISENEILKVATNDFVATGGDGFSEFLKYKFTDLGVLVREALIEDVKAHHGINLL